MLENTARLIASWSGNAAAWTDAVRENRIASRREVTDAAIVEAVRRASPRRLLDVGCGEGWLCRALQPLCDEIVGVDVSPELIEAAHALGGADFHCVDYARLIDSPTVVGTDFDTFVCNFSLLDDRVSELLSALARIATTDASLLIQTLHPWRVDPPYADGWRTENFTSFGEAGWQPMPWYSRTLSSWVDALSAGWRLLSIEEPRAATAKEPASLLITACRLE